MYCSSVHVEAAEHAAEAAHTVPMRRPDRRPRRGVRGAPSPPFTVGDAQTAECRDRFELPGSFAILLSSVALDTGPVARRAPLPDARARPRRPTTALIKLSEVASSQLSRGPNRSNT